MIRRLIVWVVVIAALAGLVTIFAEWIIPHRPEIVSDATRAAVDSLHATQPAHDSTRAARVVRETVYVRQGDAAHDAGTAARKRADVLERSRDSAVAVADSLASVATDAASWHATYDAEHVARVTGDSAIGELHVAVDSLDRAYHAERSARITADSIAQDDSTRAAVAVATVDRIMADVAKAEQCKWLGFIPCPSRRVAVVTGAVAGAIAGGLVVRKARDRGG